MYTNVCVYFSESDVVSMPINDASLILKLELFQCVCISAYNRVVCVCVDGWASFYACARMRVYIDACEYVFAQTTTKYLLV